MDDSKGRNRTITVRGKSIEVPFFMPDATRAVVRGIFSEQLSSAGTTALVVNTYHLMLSPGSELVARAGGIHQFMQWKGLTLSDSGGYQVYSLIHKNPEMGRVTEEGAEFRSVIDGSKHILTPERSIQIQFDLGVDMMVVLDDPRPNSAPEEEINLAVERTVRWAGRCREEYDRQVKARGLTEEARPLIFGVVQGGKSRELRKKCVEGLTPLNFDGYGFGARHIDDDGTFLEDIVRYTAEILPEDKLRFALGVGTPEDIVRFHNFGWDMFDCVIPTREGRHGRLFVANNLPVTNNKQQATSDDQSRKSEDAHTTQQPTTNDAEQNAQSDILRGARCATRYTTLNITNGKFREDFGVIEEGCGCMACAGGYTRAYIHHLFAVGETLGGQLATLHNLFFYNKLMRGLRKGE